ncbi:hypothetical protein SSPSH_003019 [Salinisphaera shabanensis E1L3A]|jgi:hypothetical protein|uniref:Uncharacterized protein n=1 Tax=Salinisphaera shabanensis E1L3A TaxID=1033802 RepID=U2FPM6_9GAMM|nr:hypothetical protein [Salinisphaera shabanensis]ERJ18104.1 hypothetical protein SSPSH_003019 [Salinisphaera shabanensis E1L3A]
MAEDPKPSPESREDYSYEAFGRDFFEHAVTVERVEQALANLTGNEVNFGPRYVGPGGLASIKAEGSIREPSVTRREGDLIEFALMIPIDLELSVRLAAHDHRFKTELRAHLRLTARAKAPLHIFIDVPAPSENDIDVKVNAQGLRASVLDLVADVEGELKRYVARYVGKQIDKPEIRRMRDIDVRRRLESNAPEQQAKNA